MKIAVIFPHPDDAAMNAAGTLARWSAEGHEITAICCTRGDVGTRDRHQTREELGRLRSEELMEANAILGIQHTEFLEFPDGCVMDPEALRRDLVRCVRQFRPERVLTMDPWVRYEVHRDHITVGQMASEAAAFACFPLLYPEQISDGLEPHNAREVWYMGLLGRAPNVFVSIEEHIDKKIAALLEFKANLAVINDLCDKEGEMSPQLEKDASSQADEQRARRWIESLGRKFGHPVGLKAAEAFVALRCAPGHFDNFIEIQNASLGLPPPDPLIIS